MSVLLHRRGILTKQTVGGGGAGVFVSDTFTDTAGTTLASHTGGTGATWTKHPSSAAATADISTTIPNRLKIGNSDVMYYASGTPTNADYDVEADIITISTAGPHFITGRMDTTANTFYGVRINGGTNKVELYKRVAGTFTLLNDSAETVTSATTYHVKLEMRGTAIKAYVDGVLRCSATDSAIAAAGRAGFRGGGADAEGSGGQYIDNFVATNA